MLEWPPAAGSRKRWWVSTMRVDLKKITSLCFTEQGREEPQRPSLTVMHLFPVSLSCSLQEIIRAHLTQRTAHPLSSGCRPWLSLSSALLPRPSLTDGPQCGSPSGLRSALKGTCHSGTYQPPLATHGRPNLIEVANSCLRSDLWVCTHLLELNHSALCSSSASMFHQGMQANFCQFLHTSDHSPDCGSLMIGQAAECHQMRGALLNLHNTSHPLSI